MQINLDMGQIIQMKKEQDDILKICIDCPQCINCPMKKDGYIQTQTSTWRCENASEVQRTE